MGCKSCYKRETILSSFSFDSEHTLIQIQEYKYIFLEANKIY